MSILYSFLQLWNELPWNISRTRNSSCLVLWCGVWLVNATHLIILISMWSISLLVGLLTVTFTGMTWPTTNPVFGIEAVKITGSDAQKIQQKVLISSCCSGILNWGSKFKSSGRITVNSNLKSKSNFQGRSNTTRTRYRMNPYFSFTEEGAPGAIKNMKLYVWWPGTISKIKFAFNIFENYITY